MKKFSITLVLFLLIGFSGFVTVKYWSYLFARTVNGVISDVQRVSMPVAVLSGQSDGNNNKELFSFAVGILEDSGEIVTSSSEDRQWAVAKPGQCAQAKFYPYPPWEFEKSGTYFNARLIRLHACDTNKFIPLNKQSLVPEEANKAIEDEPTETLKKLQGTTNSSPQ
jgi:hypothetical protein